MKNHSIADRFMKAELVLKNSKNNDEISMRLKEYGYDDERLAEGEKLYEKAFDLYTRQKREYGDQYQATDEKLQERSKIHQLYMRHIALARLAFKNDTNAAASLDLFGRRKRSFSNWLVQAKLFYENLLSTKEWMDAMVKFGVTEAKLKETNIELDKIENIYNNQQKEKGEAQESTKERDDAFEALDEWLADFFTVVRLALHDKAQLLESFGVVVPSRHYEMFAEEEKVS